MLSRSAALPAGSSSHAPFSAASNDSKPWRAGHTCLRLARLMQIIWQSNRMQRTQAWPWPSHAAAACCPWLVAHGTLQTCACLQLLAAPLKRLSGADTWSCWVMALKRAGLCLCPTACPTQVPGRLWRHLRCPRTCGARPCTARACAPRRLRCCSRKARGSEHGSRSSGDARRLYPALRSSHVFGAEAPATQGGLKKGAPGTSRCCNQYFAPHASPGSPCWHRTMLSYACIMLRRTNLPIVPKRGERQRSLDQIRQDKYGNVLASKVRTLGKAESGKDKRNN